MPNIQVKPSLPPGEKVTWMQNLMFNFSKDCYSCRTLQPSYILIPLFQSQPQIHGRILKPLGNHASFCSCFKFIFLWWSCGVLDVLRMECALLSVLSHPLSVDSLLQQSLWLAYVSGSTLTHDQGLMNVPGTFLPSVTNTCCNLRRKAFLSSHLGAVVLHKDEGQAVGGEMSSCVELAFSSPLFLHSRTSAHGMGPPSSRMGLPSSENIFSDTHKWGSFRLFQI